MIFFGYVVLEQKRIPRVGLVGQPAATGFFPCELFVQDDRFQTRSRQPFRCESSSRTATEDGNSFHSGILTFADWSNLD